MPERQLFLFLEPGTDPSHDQVTLDVDGIETLVVWAPDAASAADAAKKEAIRGLGIIEMYRGFDLDAVAAVMSAVGDRAAVGFAMYPYGEGSPSRIHRSATIFRAGPEAPEPVVRVHPNGGSTVVVGASDPAETVALAHGFVDDGVDLVEICGGEPLSTAAQVRAALKGRAPVSYVVYPYDSLEGAAAYKASFADAG